MRNLRSGPARLLVVDDNKVNRLLLARNLELQGHSVALAENGRVALEMLRRDGFDLILLDMEMPEMDGFQVLEQLAKDLQLRDLPVIVTSSLEGITNVVRCIELGAEDYLTKPVNPVLLKARLGASLEKKRLRDQQKELVRRFATAEVAQDLQESGFSLGGKRVRGSVMFSDIRDFTPLSNCRPRAVYEPGVPSAGTTRSLRIRAKVSLSGASSNGTPAISSAAAVYASR